MTKTLSASLLVLACVGCAGPTITSRAVDGEASWFVRLDTYTDGHTPGDLRYDHPADWAEADLAAILGRLLVVERAGILERKPLPQPLFASSEVKQLASGLRRAFRIARATEWAVFYSALPAGTAQEVTSGGLFIRGSRLHVVVANHHERVSSNSDSLAAVRANPLTPLGGRGFALSFDPAKFVSATQATWTGESSAAPASELILDHSAFLADTRAAAASATAPLSLATPSPGMASTPAPSAAPSPAVPKAGTKDQAYASLKEQVAALQDEIARLRRRLEEQDDELAQLKTRLVELDLLSKNPPRKKPGR